MQIFKTINHHFVPHKMAETVLGECFKNDLTLSGKKIAYKTTYAMI